MRPFEHLTVHASGEAIPRSPDSEANNTRLIAGGTDLLPLLKDNLVTAGPADRHQARARATSSRRSRLTAPCASAR